MFSSFVKSISVQSILFIVTLLLLLCSPSSHHHFFVSAESLVDDPQCGANGMIELTGGDNKGNVTVIAPLSNCHLYIHDITVNKIVFQPGLEYTGGSNITIRDIQCESKNQEPSCIDFRRSVGGITNLTIENVFRVGRSAKNDAASHAKTDPITVIKFSEGLGSVSNLVYINNIVHSGGDLEDSTDIQIVEARAFGSIRYSVLFILSAIESIPRLHINNITLANFEMSNFIDSGSGSQTYVIDVDRDIANINELHQITIENITMKNIKVQCHPSQDTKVTVARIGEEMSIESTGVTASPETTLEDSFFTLRNVVAHNVRLHLQSNAQDSVTASLILADFTFGFKGFRNVVIDRLFVLGSTHQELDNGRTQLVRQAPNIGGPLQLILFKHAEGLPDQIVGGTNTVRSTLGGSLSQDQNSTLALTNFVISEIRFDVRTDNEMDKIRFFTTRGISRFMTVTFSDFLFEQSYFAVSQSLLSQSNWLLTENEFFRFVQLRRASDTVPLSCPGDTSAGIYGSLTFRRMFLRKETLSTWEPGFEPISQGISMAFDIPTFSGCNLLVDSLVVHDPIIVQGASDGSSLDVRNIHCAMSRGFIHSSEQQNGASSCIHFAGSLQECRNVSVDNVHWNYLNHKNHTQTSNTQAEETLAVIRFSDTISDFVDWETRSKHGVFIDNISFSNGLIDSSLTAARVFNVWFDPDCVVFQVGGFVLQNFFIFNFHITLVGASKPVIVRNIQMDLSDAFTSVSRLKLDIFGIDDITASSTSGFYLANTFILNDLVPASSYKHPNGNILSMNNFLVSNVFTVGNSSSNTSMNSIFNVHSDNPGSLSHARRYNYIHFNNMSLNNNNISSKKGFSSCANIVFVRVFTARDDTIQIVGSTLEVSNLYQKDNVIQSENGDVFVGGFSQSASKRTMSGNERRGSIKQFRNALLHSCHFDNITIRTALATRFYALHLFSVEDIENNLEITNINVNGLHIDRTGADTEVSALKCYGDSTIQPVIRNVSRVLCSNIQMEDVRIISQVDSTTSNQQQNSINRISFRPVLFLTFSAELAHRQKDKDAISRLKQQQQVVIGCDEYEQYFSSFMIQNITISNIHLQATTTEQLSSVDINTLYVANEWRGLHLVKFQNISAVNVTMDIRGGDSSSSLPLEVEFNLIKSTGQFKSVFGEVPVNFPNIAQRLQDAFLDVPGGLSFIVSDLTTSNINIFADAPTAIIKEFHILQLFPSSTLKPTIGFAHFLAENFLFENIHARTNGSTLLSSRTDTAIEIGIAKMTGCVGIIPQIVVAELPISSVINTENIITSSFVFDDMLMKNILIEVTAYSSLFYTFFSDRYIAHFQLVDFTNLFVENLTVHTSVEKNNTHATNHGFQSSTSSLGGNSDIAIIHMTKQRNGVVYCFDIHSPASETIPMRNRLSTSPSPISSSLRQIDFFSKSRWRMSNISMKGIEVYTRDQSSLLALQFVNWVISGCNSLVVSNINLQNSIFGNSQQHSNSVTFIDLRQLIALYLSEDMLAAISPPSMRSSYFDSIHQHHKFEISDTLIQNLTSVSLNFFPLQKTSSPSLLLSLNIGVPNWNNPNTGTRSIMRWRTVLFRNISLDGIVADDAPRQVSVAAVRLNGVVEVILPSISDAAASLRPAVTSSTASSITFNEINLNNIHINVTSIAAFLVELRAVMVYREIVHFDHVYFTNIRVAKVKSLSIGNTPYPHERNTEEARQEEAVSPSDDSSFAGLTLLLMPNFVLKSLKNPKYQLTGEGTFLIENITMVNCGIIKSGRTNVDLIKLFQKVEGYSHVLIRNNGISSIDQFISRKPAHVGNLNILSFTSTSGFEYVDSASSSSSYIISNISIVNVDFGYSSLALTGVNFDSCSISNYNAITFEDINLNHININEARTTTTHHNASSNEEKSITVHALYFHGGKSSLNLSSSSSSNSKSLLTIRGISLNNFYVSSSTSSIIINEADITTVSMDLDRVTNATHILIDNIRFINNFFSIANQMKSMVTLGNFDFTSRHSIIIVKLSGSSSSSSSSFIYSRIKLHNVTVLMNDRVNTTTNQSIFAVNHKGGGVFESSSSSLLELSSSSVRDLFIKSSPHHRTDPSSSVRQNYQFFQFSPSSNANELQQQQIIETSKLVLDKLYYENIEIDAVSSSSSSSVFDYLSFVRFSLPVHNCRELTINENVMSKLYFNFSSSHSSSFPSLDLMFVQFEKMKMISSSSPKADENENFISTTRTTSLTNSIIDLSTSKFHHHRNAIFSVRPFLIHHHHHHGVSSNEQSVARNEYLIQNNTLSTRNRNEISLENDECHCTRETCMLADLLGTSAISRNSSSQPPPNVVAISDWTFIDNKLLQGNNSMISFSNSTSNNNKTDIHQPPSITNITLKDNFFNSSASSSSTGGRGVGINYPISDLLHYNNHLDLSRTLLSSSSWYLDCNKEWTKQDEKILVERLENIYNVSSVNRTCLHRATATSTMSRPTPSSSSSIELTNFTKSLSQSIETGSHSANVTSSSSLSVSHPSPTLSEPTPSLTTTLVPPLPKTVSKLIRDAETITSVAAITQLTAVSAVGGALRSKRVLGALGRLSTGNCGLESAAAEVEEQPDFVVSPFQIYIPKSATNDDDVDPTSYSYKDPKTNDTVYFKSLPLNRNGGYLSGMIVGNVVFIFSFALLWWGVAEIWRFLSKKYDEKQIRLKDRKRKEKKKKRLEELLHSTSSNNSKNKHKKSNTKKHHQNKTERISFRDTARDLWERFVESNACFALLFVALLLLPDTVAATGILFLLSEITIFWKVFSAIFTFGLFVGLFFLAPSYFLLIKRNPKIEEFEEFDELLSDICKKSSSPAQAEDDDEGKNTPMKKITKKKSSNDTSNDQNKKRLILLNDTFSDIQTTNNCNNDDDDAITIPDHIPDFQKSKPSFIRKLFCYFFDACGEWVPRDEGTVMEEIALDKSEVHQEYEMFLEVNQKRTFNLLHQHELMQETNDNEGEELETVLLGPQNNANNNTIGFDSEVIINHLRRKKDTKKKRHKILVDSDGRRVVEDDTIPGIYHPIVSHYDISRFYAALPLLDSFTVSFPEWIFIELAAFIAIAFAQILGILTNNCEYEVVFLIIVLLLHATAAMYYRPYVERVNQYFAVPVFALLQVIILIGAMRKTVDNDVLDQLAMTLGIAQSVIAACTLFCVALPGWDVVLEKIEYHFYVERVKKERHMTNLENVMFDNDKNNEKELQLSDVLIAPPPVESHRKNDDKDKNRSSTTRRRRKKRKDDDKHDQNTESKLTSKSLAALTRNTLMETL